MRPYWAALLATVCACGGGGGGAADEARLRPAGSPDVVVASVSGRCGPLCDSPATNQPYLGYAGGAAEAVAGEFERAGYSTARWHFVSSMYSYDDDGDGKADRDGFLALIEFLDWVHSNWMSGFDNPSKLVIVAHSHGCVWAHLATRHLQHIPVDYLISLDGVCFLWESDYEADIDDYCGRYGNPVGWDFSNSCDCWVVPEQEFLMDTEDVVWPGVAVNLEVRSSDFWGVQDPQLNYRSDGTRRDIYTHDSPDWHNDVHDPAGESMPWVLWMIWDLGY